MADKVPIGLQLFSVRGECNKDLPASLKGTADIGYVAAEPWGFSGEETEWLGWSAKEIRKMYDDNDLICCGFHLATGALLGDNLERTIEFNQELGNKYLIIAKAVLEGAFGLKSSFVRTPKFSVEGNKGDWMSKKYRCKVGFVAVLEITFGIYFTLANIYAWNLGIYGIMPFLLLFQYGCLYMGLWALTQSLKRSNLRDSFERILASMHPYRRMTS